MCRACAAPRCSPTRPGGRCSNSSSGVISTRAVSAHVKKAADMLGSRGRAQLGYLIARAGLLDDAGIPVPERHDGLSAA